NPVKIPPSASLEYKLTSRKMELDVVLKSTPIKFAPLLFVISAEPQVITRELCAFIKVRLFKEVPQPFRISPSNKILSQNCILITLVVAGERANAFRVILRKPALKMV